MHKKRHKPEEMNTFSPERTAAGEFVTRGRAWRGIEPCWKSDPRGT